MKERSRRRRGQRQGQPVLKPLACSCAAAMGLGAATAFAQEAAAQGGAPAEQTAQAQQAAQLEEVLVTGSRIVRSGMTTPTPVTIVSTDELSLMAPNNMIEGLSELPEFYANTSSAAPGNFFVTPGSGNLNLRGLGTNRTLVLLNGRRVVSSTRYGGTDINVFPETMIKSVETVTGGASAAYGTDAVAGVTNFILNTDYNGISGHVQSGATSRNDNRNWEAAFAFGSDIGKKFHLQFSTDHFQQDGVFTYEGRDWYKSWGIVTNPDPNGPTNLVRPYVVSTSATFDGLITAPGTPLNMLNFNSEGTGATPFVVSPISAVGKGTRSQSIAGGTGSGDFIGADRPTLTPKFSRGSSFLYLDYQVNDKVKLFVQGIHGNSTTTSNNLAGQFQAFFSPMIIYSGNAFLPASIQKIMDDNNIPSFTLNRMGHSSDLAKGGASVVQDSTMTENTIGLDAKLKGTWSLSGYYQRGESKTKSSQIGGIRIDRIHMATDAVVDPATGAIVCHVTLVSGLYPDCVPLNPFGRGNMSQAAIDWVTGFDPGQRIDTPLYYTQSGYDLGLRDSYISEAAKVVRADIIQKVFEVSVNGEILPDFRPGAVSVAAGVGYREESINQIVRSPALPDGNLDAGRPVPANDPALGIRGQSPGDVNNSVAIQYSKVPNIRGKMDVSEAFGELLVPLVNSTEHRDRLNLSAAARYADYSGSGKVWAYKLGLDSQLTKTFRVRATDSHDVRAGTLSERFDQTGGAASVNDPFNNDMAVNIFQTSGGDPNIKPEESDTVTAGIVYQPSWAEALSFSLDEYEVSLKDAIDSLTPQQVLDQCYAGDMSLCERVHRLPDGTINLIQANVLNVAKAKVRGADFEADYRKDVHFFGGAPESFGFRIFSSHLAENSTQGFDSPVIDRAGQTNAFELPKDKVTGSVSYSHGPLSGFLQVRWIGPGIRNTLDVEGVNIDDNTIDAVTYLDLNVRYQLPRGEGAWEFYGNVTNLTDTDPPVVANFGFFGASATQTNAGLYDLLGRRFTMGARFSF